MLIKVTRNMIVFGNNKNKGHKHESQTYTCGLVSIVHLTFSINQSINKNHIGGVMVSVLASSALHRGFELRSDKNKIGIFCFSTKHTALRRKSKNWLARNQDKVSE